MNMNKIIAILGIALLAIVTVGAASAAEISTGLTPSVSGHTYEKGILTIPINDHVDDLPNVGAWNYTPCPEPTLNAWTPEHPEPTIDLLGHGNTISTHDVTGYFHNGDFPKGSAQDTTSMEMANEEVGPVRP